MGPVTDDPVLRQRARVATLVSWGMRAGYGFLAIAVIVFVIGAVGRFTPLLTSVVTLAMAGCTLTLAPSIVFAYAVRAAEREDREQGH
ncbi:MAG: hypothetical protein QOI20_2628 [Acidimicrobiaceae bacterium]|jgi:hypothetical protein|nr:hypothetical protein [Acidimicrobiaceae bacterium]